MSRLIWDGDDYISEVWQEWLEDFEGLMVVAEWFKVLLYEKTA